MKRLITAFAVLCALALPASATTLYNYTFEAGSDTLLGAPYNLAFNTYVPAAVLTEGSNHFLRQYASYMNSGNSDCGPSFNTTCPVVRSENFIGTIDYRIYPSVTATFRIRMSSAAQNGYFRLLAQFFQYGPCPVNCGSATSRMVDITGPNLSPVAGEYTMDTKNGDYTVQPMMEIGAFPADTWVNVSMTVTFSDVPDGGSAQISINGVNKGTTLARTLQNSCPCPTNIGTGTPDNTFYPMYFYTMIYGPATGTPVSPVEYVDFDDIIIQTPAATGTLIHFVQFTDGGMGGSSSTITATMDSNTTSGNALVVCGFWINDVTLSSISISSGSASFTDSGAGRVARPTSGYLQCQGATNIAGGTTPTITLTLSGAAVFTAMKVIEYSGVSITDMWDVSTTGTATSATSLSSGSFTPTATNGAVLAFAITNNGLSSVASFTKRTGVDEQDYLGDRTFSTAQSAQTVTVNYDTTFDRAAVLVAALNAQPPPTPAFGNIFINPFAVGAAQ